MISRNDCLFLLNLILCLSIFISCSQKEIRLEIAKLEPQELRIYFNRKDHPKTAQDDNGNYYLKFDTAKAIYTSTTFSEMKSVRIVYCFMDLGNRCLREYYEIEDLGYRIDVYSHFTSAASGKEEDQLPYDRIIIERLKR